MRLDICMGTRRTQWHCNRDDVRHDGDTHYSVAATDLHKAFLLGSWGPGTSNHTHY